VHERKTFKEWKINLLACLLGKESICENLLLLFLTSPVTYSTSLVFPSEQLSLQRP
jgi:hypothetical protein